jgi:hypothetical protein
MVGHALTQIPALLTIKKEPILLKYIHIINYNTKYVDNTTEFCEVVDQTMWWIK